MTITHVAPPFTARDLDSAIAQLRRRGLRLSSARRLVLEGLFAADGPVTAEAIADGVDGQLPVSDLASVYRNLETLEEIGLVRHVHVGHGAGLYALSCNGEREYVACEHCGELEAVAPKRLDGVRDLVERELGYRPRFSHFPLVGACAGCLRLGRGRHVHA